MRMNRRNVLIGLGTIVAGGGAALGTGAFSSVEATRDVSIKTDGDGAAVVNLEIDTSSSAVADSSSAGEGEMISFDTESLNKEAITSFDEVLTVSHNEDNESYDISIDTEDTGLTFYEDTNRPGSDSLNLDPISSDEDAKIGIAVNTENLSENDEPSFTVTAE